MPPIPEDHKTAIVFMAGPIKYWWDENWELPLHWHYDAWREALRAALIADGHYLTIAPWLMCKGTWTEEAQSLNDTGLAISHVVLDMTPPGVPSEGTVSEIKQVSSTGKAIVQAPPPANREDFDDAIRVLIRHIESLGVHHDMVDQDDVIECIGWQDGRAWLFNAMSQEYAGRVFRLHYHHEDGSLVVVDVSGIHVSPVWRHVDAEQLHGKTWRFDVSRLLKVEVLNRQWQNRYPA